MGIKVVTTTTTTSTTMTTNVFFYFLLILCSTLQWTWAYTYDKDEWSDWSEWSPCSRTCDGGVTQQFRKCKSLQGCHGVSIRRKMCNMQGCGDYRDYRWEQCKAFNGMEYREMVRSWEPSQDPDNLCSLTCRAEGTDFIVKLAPKVRDGTRCRAGALHVCVNGKCESVGCDLKIGSPKKVDECGICGGDGTACSTPIYRWEITSNGPCNANCGGGQQPVKVICRNGLTEEKVDPLLCNSQSKPYRTFQNCNIHPCQPKWKVGNWSDCSTSCGGGMRVRKVFCSHDKNKTNIQVADKLCLHVQRPPRQEPCNQTPCSHWHVGPWSACSTTCGRGYRTRNVVCRDPSNLPSSSCDKRMQPSDRISCADNGVCPTEEEDEGVGGGGGGGGSGGGNTKEEYSEDVPVAMDRNHLVQLPHTFHSSNYPFSFPMEEDGYIEPLEEVPREHTLPLIQPYPPMDNAVLLDHNAIPSEPTFVAEEWGPCSQTCGEGVRKRDVKCKIFLEFSRTIANLPDKECPGPKPSETESCFARPCSHQNGRDKESEDLENLSDSHHAALADSDSTSYRKTISVGLPPGISMNDMTYSWKVIGYSPCSASCLGGIQEAMIQCVRDFDQRIATPVLCMDRPQPDIATTRTCNDHSCPPRWNVSEFGTCSKACGGGVMTREVNCIHEVTRGNTVIVPPGICPQPTPRTEILCNTVSCPPYWEPGEWSRCSKSCGGGERTRALYCKQVIALGQFVLLPAEEGHCTEPRPMDSRPCNKKACLGRKGVGEDADKFIQEEYKRKLTLNVKGHWTVYNGVAIKLRCPAGKGVDRHRLVWMKGHQFVSNNIGRVELLNNGVLKIFNSTFSDSGVYTCLNQGRLISNLTLMVRPYNAGEERARNSLEKKSRKPNHESTLFADQQIFTARGEVDSSAEELLQSAKRWGAKKKKIISLPRRSPHYLNISDCSNRKISCARSPSWKLGNWSICLAHLCFNWNSAFKTRRVHCEFPNGTEAGDPDCHEVEKPVEKEECYHSECIGMWRTEKWSQCKSLCGSLGFKTRILKCVWSGSNLPAGSACQLLARPIVKKPCRGQSCLRKSSRGSSNRHFHQLRHFFNQHQHE